jgi:hypothetical protein
MRASLPPAHHSFPPPLPDLPPRPLVPRLEQRRPTTDHLRAVTLRQYEDHPRDSPWFRRCNRRSRLCEPAPELLVEYTHYDYSLDRASPKQESERCAEAMAIQETHHGSEGATDAPDCVNQQGNAQCGQLEKVRHCYASFRAPRADSPDCRRCTAPELLVEYTHYDYSRSRLCEPAGQRSVRSA